MSVTFNSSVNPRAKTELFKIYINVGTASTPVWELQGRGIESWTLDRNEEIEKKIDVLGLVDIQRGKPQPVQSGIDMLIRSGSVFATMLVEAMQTGDFSALDNIDLLHKYEFIDAATTGSCYAKREKGCCVAVNSFTGEAGGYLGFNLDIHYANDFIAGSMTKVDASPVVFTPASAQAAE